MASLKDFLISKVRVKLLKIFLEDPAQIYYVRQLVRAAGEEINAVRRELLRMDKQGMVYKESRGNRLYYGFKKDYLYYHELLQLVAKSVGLGKAIVQNRNRLGKLKFALLSGKFARHRPHSESDVDVMIVGEVVMAEIAKLIKEYEVKHNREINYSVMTKDEFEFRKRRRDPFIGGVLMGSRIMLVGDEEELTS